MVFDDFKQFVGINGKQQWPQTRSLWNAIRKLKTGRCKANLRDSLRPVVKIRRKPTKGGAINAGA